VKRYGKDATSKFYSMKKFLNRIIDGILDCVNNAWGSGTTAYPLLPDYTFGGQVLSRLLTEI
jgi:hypothetical protein